jgi:hypothetical protein
MVGNEGLRHEVGARYDLSAQEAYDLCIDFLKVQENLPASSLGCFSIEGDSPFSNLGRFVESEVFMQTFGNTPEMMSEEYGPYEQTSDLFVVVDLDSSFPIGTLRVIRNSEGGLKSLNDLERSELALDQTNVCKELDIEPDRCVDVGTLAVLPEFRRRAGNVLPSLLLYRSLYAKYLSDPNYDHVVTIIDKRAERNLYRLSFPFKPIDDRYFSYLDSPESRALYGVNREFYPSVIGRKGELEQEIAESESLEKEWKATMLDGLANGTHLDEMIPFINPTEQ